MRDIPPTADAAPDSRGSAAPGADHEALGAFARELAQHAGDEIIRSLDREIVVAYKDDGTDIPVDAVTDVDRLIEEQLYALVRERYPQHGFVGEEGTLVEGGEGVVWIVDPIDGTQNFVNALPIYSSSVAAVVDGVPVAGAIWAASSHRLRPGVYHAHRGGPLCFEGAPVTEGRSAANRRRGVGQLPHDEDHHLRLEAVKGSDTPRALPYDRRHIGSGALEAAFVAAGVLQAAFNTGPHSWDIAGGIVLAEAARRVIRARDEGGWVPFERFGDGSIETLRTWRRPTFLATEETTRAMGWRVESA